MKTAFPGKVISSIIPKKFSEKLNMANLNIAHIYLEYIRQVSQVKYVVKLDSGWRKHLGNLMKTWL